ncbi:MAG: sigma-70 family RNA polymerase sigma factor [Acidiferrobacterales bacterium]|nr:sigma-70 family RNA polymerase sigma factor [Acidiferrobacterales bacterium]
MRTLIKQFKSDESLMRDYQQGDSVAFDVLYQRHKDKLFNYVYRSCQNPDVVEDIAHDTWMAIIRSAKNYQPSAKFTTYLYRIARNKVIDHWRKPKATEAIEIEPDDVSRSSLVHGQPNYGMEQLQLVSALMKALQQLPQEQREAFLLKEEGFSQNEIADITDSKPETVKSRVRYARRQLQLELGAAI